MTIKDFRAAIICMAATFAIITTTSVFNSLASADPCGMVPPIYTGDSPITRKGLQQTYVFYRDGVESFVIRPGYEGNIDNFGMLIPFPNPPSIRKIHDDVFEQVKKAVDPPEIVVDLNPPLPMARGGGGAGFGGGQMRRLSMVEDKDKIEVLREEAVGMYEVAVLAAGSPEALKKWMDENGYQFPNGMETVTGEYISDNWCFVAVKTKVSSKDGVDPKPGQRQVNPGLPSGTGFEGHVQGLAFRFPTDELVVPMRLSAFNEGDTRNLVYLLTDGAKRIRNIPEEFVRRQISGKDLVNNITQPLPLRVLGGTIDEIPQARMDRLAVQRDPKPHNGIAARLFVDDIRASQIEKGNELILAAEDSEKAIVTINERLGLRGIEVDNLVVQSMNDRAEADDATLDVLRSMTLTIVDGDFHRDVLASQNLKFDNFMMAAELNTRRNYDAKNNGPGNVPQNGNLYLGALPERSSGDETGSDVQTSISSSSTGSSLRHALLPGLSVFFVIILVGLGRYKRQPPN